MVKRDILDEDFKNFYYKAIDLSTAWEELSGDSSGNLDAFVREIEEELEARGLML